MSSQNDMKSEIQFDNLSSPNLNNFFNSRNNASYIANSRQRPSTKILQARNKLETLSETKRYSIQKNLTSETASEKRFQMKWHQLSYSQKIGRKRQSELNLMGNANDGLSNFQNSIENLIEEQEGMVVSSASPQLMDLYRKNDWNHVIIHGKQNRIEKHPYESNPSSVKFFHSDDLELQKSDLKFWEEQVRWLSERIKSNNPQITNTNLNENTKLKWKSVGWGEEIDFLSDPLLADRISKKYLKEMNAASEIRENEENSILERMLRVAEYRVELELQDQMEDDVERNDFNRLIDSQTNDHLNSSSQSDHSDNSGNQLNTINSLSGDDLSSDSPSVSLGKLSSAGSLSQNSPQSINLKIGKQITPSTLANTQSSASDDPSSSEDDEDSLSSKPKIIIPKKPMLNFQIPSVQEIDMDISEKPNIEEDSIPDIKNYVIESGDFINGILWKIPEKPEELKDFPFTKLLLDSSDRNLNLTVVSNKDSQIHSNRGNQDAEISELDIYMKSLKVRSSSEYKENLVTRYEIKHSGPADRLDPLYYPTQLSDEEYKKYYHYEMLHIQPSRQKIPIKWKPPKKARRKKHTQKAQEGLMKRIEPRSFLSAHQRRSILIESVERYPMIMNKIGMGARIMNYHHQKRFGEIQLESILDGDLRFIESSEELPLLTELNPKHGVSSIENENYNAQIFPHKVPYTDFLLTAKNKNKKIVKFQIRRIDSYYTMGHTQPLRVIPTNPGREVDIYKSNRILQFMKNKFDENLQKTGVAFVLKKDIEFAFQQKHLIREQLKNYAISKGSGRYEIKPDGMLAERLIKPEDVSCYDMMRADDVRLKDMGIDPETQKIAFGMAFDLSQNFSAPDKIDQEIIKRMSYVILDASWRKTAEFHNLISATAERNFSLLEVARVSFNSEKLKKMSEECKRLAYEELDRIRNENISITDETAKRILREQGKYSDQDIDSMSRLERKDKARQLTETYGKSESRKKQYIQILSEKKREAMRKIYKVEGEKLRKGRPLYESIETQHAVMNEDDDDERSETSMQDEGSEDNFQEEEEYVDEETELNNQIRDMVQNEEFSAGAQNQIEKSAQQTQSNGYRVVRILHKKYIHEGKLATRIEREIITDPDIVEQYRRREALKLKLAKSKKQNYEYTKEDKHMSDIFITGKKEHRRLREQYKRWHKRVKQNNEDNRFKDVKNIDGVYQTKKRKPNPKSQSQGVKVKRRRKVSIKAANERIRKIVGNFTKSNLYKMFKEPVSKDLYPDYYDVIKNPINLQEIYQKALREEYADIPSFEKDISLIESNCKHYCIDIHPEYEQVANLVEDLVSKLRESLEKRREEIERAFHGQAISNQENDT